ncbi:TonB-dependent receptor [Sphingomonas morindae]|uniref:TonB-dependent receptor n=1 Tax=Sphingomonas morindae TaxID=1541170 RepID=A0ABY4XDP8_9SPHN|nr:TonB-dependent receptor [Sphingomonas morindae]USI74973.1 TonB-dependent receptor [Sphingomonas morindae]
MRIKNVLLGSASLAGLLHPAVGMAQAQDQASVTAPAPTANEGDQAPTNATAAQPAAASNAAPAQPTQEIVVTGIRASLAAAETIKRKSDQIVDAIVAQDIGKFPDPTVASALQRVPGVQVVVGDNNEIQNPLVRGLGDILSTLNGREVFTGAGRGFSFQDIPAEALAGAQVYKNNSANMIEGGVAGLINLDLHRPFDFKGFTIAGSIRNTLSTNLNQSYPSASLLISDRFDTGIGEIGVLVNASYSRTKFDRPVAFDDLLRSGNHGPPGAAGALLPTGTGGLNQFGTYSRPQINASIQWKPSPDWQVYADGMFAGYRNRSSTAFIINDAFAGSRIGNLQTDNNCNDYSVNGAGFYDPAGTVEHLCNATSYTSYNGVGFTSNQAHQQHTNDFIFGGGVKYDHDRLHADVDVSYEKSTYYSKTFIIDIGKRLPQIDITTNRDNGVDFNVPGNPLAQPDGFYFTNGLDDDRLKSNGTLFATQADAKYDVGGLLDEIQVGGRYARRIGRYQEVIVNPAAPGGAYATPVDGQGLPANFLQTVPGVPRIYGGSPWLQPGTDVLLDPAVEDRLRQIFLIPTGDQPYDPARSFYAKEQTYAGYVQGKYKIGIVGDIALDGLVGVRYTRTDRSIAGTGSVIGTNGGTTLVPVSRSTSDTNWLPNASARLTLTKGLQARASYAKVLSRPDFGSLNPGLNYAVSTNQNIQNGGSQGNPDLKPQKADELDATLEYYFGRSNYISAGVYQKTISDRVITNGVDTVIGTNHYLIQTPRNLGKARLRGLEVSAQYFLDFLPGPLSGFGLFGNYTIADSKVTSRSDPLYGFPLLGVSKYNYNAGLLYEKYGASFRLIYTHRSKYYDGDNTTSVNIRPVDQPIILNGVRPNGRLDFSLNYDVTRNITLTADGTNITRARYESFYYAELNPHDIRFDDSTYSIGVRFRF